MIKRSTYEKVEKVSKWLTILFGWTCWILAFWSRRYWLLALGLLPYLAFYNYYVRGVLVSRVEQDESGKEGRAH